MKREALASKIFVMGIDGLDPRLSRKLLDEGKMPNLAKFIEAGVSRHDLSMLGAHPMVTPPMWTTMSTGAYPVTHGITGFNRQSPGSLDTREYNISSEYCHAEPLWNVFAEAGKKTLVWHWPGSSWPPTSDSENLYVVDGTQPAGPNNGVAMIDAEVILIADVKTEEACFRKKAASDEDIPCVISNLKASSDLVHPFERATAPIVKNIMLDKVDGESGISETPFDVVLSPIKSAEGWKIEIPSDSKEFTILFSKGFIRRPSLILKNADGVYDTVRIYKSKKSAEIVAELPLNKFVPDIVDEGFKDDVKYPRCNRNMRVLEIAPDGNHLKMWISSAMDMDNDSMWHPKSLYKIVTEHAGYPKPTALLGGASKQLILDCMAANWSYTAEWTSNALNYLMENEGFDVVFSHFHNIDLQGHMIVKYLKDKGHNKMPEEEYQKCFEQVYIQTDNYIGKYLHLLDEGWTVLILSDHAAVCPEHEPPMIGDGSGCNVRLLQQLGFTALKKDENGNDIKEIDWENTRAVCNRGIHIYVNLKGRDQHGIVDPKDKYELEEEIMTALYGYRDPDTGKRVCALALRNKDAVVLGLGGPECGDIIYFNAEGYNYDHADALSTTYGYAHTSEGPAFVAAGPGFKKGFVTDRILRQVDVAPTIAVLGGVRFPHECEGAPMYPLFTEEI